MIPATIENVNEFVLKHFRGYGVVAGGFVRDHIAGKPQKDIDIFIDMENSPCSREELVEILLDLYPDITASGRRNDEEVEYDFEVCNITGLFPLPTQLMFVEFGGTAPDYVDRNFDYGICQIGMENGELFSSPAYDKDMKNKTITVVNSDLFYYPSYFSTSYDDRPLLIPTWFNPDGFKRTVEHGKRIQEKYPDHRIIGIEQIKERLIEDFIS